jgi:hypothetical protein
MPATSGDNPPWSGTAAPFSLVLPATRRADRDLSRKASIASALPILTVIAYAAFHRRAIRPITGQSVDVLNLEHWRRHDAHARRSIAL